MNLTGGFRWYCQFHRWPIQYQLEYRAKFTALIADNAFFICFFAGM